MGCQNGHPQHTMIPLSLGPGGLCVVGRNGRSAWVCARRTCVDALLARPGSASRAFRARVRLHPELIEQILAWRGERQRRWLRTAYRSGLLVIPEPDDAELDPECDHWLTTHDHNDPTIDQNKLSKRPACTFVMAIGEADVSAIIGLRRCTLLGIRPGRATQSLLDSLRRWDSVG